MATDLLHDWFANVDVFNEHRDLNKLKNGIKAGLLNRQDESGATALFLACAGGWTEGVRDLLTAGADTEVRLFRTGTTVLYEMVQRKNAELIALLLKAGANPDTPNYWGVTPRGWNPDPFKAIPEHPAPLPPPHIQNAEHLAEAYYPKFKIPERAERESLQPGAAVDLYIYGPKEKGKQDTIKVRITQRSGDGAETRYTATVETPPEKTHLPADTKTLEFGPEHIATVYLQRAKK
jgi:hypothetical protein